MRVERRETGEEDTSEQTQTTDCVKEKGEREESNRAESAKKEIVAATWNVRTLAVKGNNGLSHAEILLLRAQKSPCDIIGCRR